MMTLVKKLMISIMMATSMFAISTTVFAGKEDAKVAQALTDTIATLEETIGLVESGADNDTIKQGIVKAKQHQKEYRYEQTERKRQYAAEHIKKAYSALKAEDKATLLSELKEALAGYQEMKPIYDAAH